MAENDHPKVFISYSWTSEAYKERVLKLAERLVNDGVDVIFDRWDLRPGQDMYAFMEQSIRDAEKVLILCEEGYAKKADNRTGGVGTETQIITPDVYGEYKQEKFIPIIMEIPKAVPSYLKSRYALYVTKDEEIEYRTLCRYIYGLGERKKPSLGKRPTWLEDEPSAHKEAPADSELLKPNLGTTANGDRIKPELGKKPEWLQDKGKKPDDRTKKPSGSGTTVAGKQPVTKAPASKRRLILRKGDKYEFGHYPMERDGKDEPLVWRVLDVDIKKRRALLITENLIDCRKYHEKSKDVTWEGCDLRKWLNGEFMDRAFDEKELRKIAVTSIMSSDNTEYATKGARATKDKLFVLSIDEAEKYFRDDMDRRAAVTPYAESHGSFRSNFYSTADGQPTSWWWLRSPGYYYSVSIVYYFGGVHSDGSIVNNDYVSVRPALWLNL